MTLPVTAILVQMKDDLKEAMSLSEYYRTQWKIKENSSINMIIVIIKF